MTTILAAFTARARRLASPLGVALLVAACEGGSGQSGSAFVFLTVDGFSATTGTTAVSTSNITASTAQTSTSSACVTLRNNLKNPGIVTSPSALDDVTIQSYTVSVNGQTFTFGTAVRVPAAIVKTTGTGTSATTTTDTNTATFSVIVVPAGAKGPAGAVTLAEFEFRGRDGRGQSVSAEGAVTVVFQNVTADSTCTAGTTTPSTGGNGTTSLKRRR